MGKAKCGPIYIYRMCTSTCIHVGETDAIVVAKGQARQTSMHCKSIYMVT